MTFNTLLNLANHSGGVLYVILAMLFVALTIIIERSWFLHRVSRCGHAALQQIDRFDQLDPSTLSMFAERYRGLPIGRIFSTAARVHGPRTREELDANFEEVIMREAPRIDRLLWVLDTIPVEVIGDIDLLFGAIENLLDNALKFTPGGGQVTLEVWNDNGFTTLQVTDTGPGIDVGERKAVLRPFYRSAGAQAHMTAGHGLGLSLVAAIARMHGADFEIGDNQPGCKMLLRFTGSCQTGEPVTQ
jgi:signal transduction histidine kinase